MSLTRHEHRHGVSVQTSVRIWGEQQIDEFEALCLLLGRRPHELAMDLVLDGIRRYRDDPAVAPAVADAVEIRRAHRQQRRPRHCEARRAGLSVIDGGAS